MTETDAGEEGGVAAGRLSPWAIAMRAALRDGGGSDVPCGECTACCTSSQFVHIDPDEADTIAHIPAELLFPAPRMAKGHLLLGYDQRGHCPMLADGKCSIYHHRPRACRTYDCRVFAAAGLVPAGETRTRIAERVERWRFDVADDEDRARLASVRAAVHWLEAHHDLVATGSAEPDTVRLAVLAIEIHPLFADGADPGVEAVRVALGRRPDRTP